MRTQRILIAECHLPLPRPIRLGPIEIRTRNYVAIRMVTDAGSHGDAFGYPRATPLFDAVTAAAHQFLGVEPSHRAAAIGRYLGAGATVRPHLVRAASLFDIALTDIFAKSVAAPLHHLLGAARTRVPVSAIAGYQCQDRSIDDIADEVRGLLDAGYPRVKIMLHGGDAAFDRRYAATIAKVAGARLGADAHWSFTSLAAAHAALSQLDDLSLAYIEDPFPAHRNALIGRLQALLATRLAAGEDMPDAESLAELARDIVYLRVDATTCGGISAAVAASHAAALGGVEVLPHVFLPLHAQLAAANLAVGAVEFSPPASGVDPIERLLLRPIRIEDGHVAVDAEPGAGMALDWDQVERWAVRRHVVAADA